MSDETVTQEAEKNKPLTPEDLIARLKKALAKDGDFPANAKIVNELRKLVSDPKTTANQVTEIILHEPSLGVRVLHLVNSTFYRRAKPIMTVSQAVIQIGMKPLAEMCSGLILLQKFVPTARQGGVFANCLRKTILTSLLSSSINSEVSKAKTGKTDESGFLAGCFAELGSLLLAYYFPQIYESAIKRAESKRQDLEQSIQEITGLSPLRISMEIIESLELPPFFKETLVICESGNVSADPKGVALEKVHIARVASSLYAARQVSEVITGGKSKTELDAVLGKLKNKVGLDANHLNMALGQLPVQFKEHCSSIELSLPSLPDFVTSYAADGSQKVKEASTEKDQFSQFVEEIRLAVENREPTASIITTAMETFSWGLQFDRVLLMLVAPGKTRLQGRMLLGNVPGFDPKSFSRPLGPEALSNAPDARAVKESRPIFNGEPLLEGGWPLTVVPIGFGHRCIGVIYADRDSIAAGASPKELGSREQAAIGVLAELLDRSIGV